MTTPLHNVYEYVAGHDPVLIAAVATSAEADELIARCVARRTALSGEVVARFDDPEAADGHPGHVVHYRDGDTSTYRVTGIADDDYAAERAAQRADDELADTLDVFTLAADPVPASDRPGAQRYRATLSRDDVDGDLIHLDVSTGGGAWRDTGEPLTIAAARALAATLAALADQTGDDQ